MSGIDYRRVFAAVDEPLLICAVTSGHIHDANDAFRELLGPDADGLLDAGDGTPTPLSAVIDPVDGSPAPLDAYRNRDADDDAVTVDATLAAPGKRSRPIEVSLEPLSESHVLVTVVTTDGGPTADLTSVLPQLVEHTPDVMWMFSADWEEYVFVNSAYEDVFGRSLSTLREDPADFLRGTHPDDREDVRAAMKRLSAGHEVDIEYRVDESSDYERHVWVHGVPIKNDAGEVYRVAGFVREVTERHERELELLRQRNLVRNVPIGVFRVALADDQTVLQVNPALVSMLDADGREQLVGQDVTEFYHGGDLAPAVGDRLREEESVTFETKFETLSGDTFWGRVTTIRQTDDAGRPIADGVIEDITARKRRHRQLRVVDRILRHNIRNDVSVISGYATYLREELEANADVIESIVDRSRDLLRTAEKGHVVVDVLSDARDPVAFDLVPEIEDTVDDLAKTHPDASIETTLPDRAAVAALREIDLAVYELAENSIVHHDGTPTIGIGVVTTDDAVEIRISDDGPGIPQREYEILSGTHDVDPLSHGSGMGMWLVYWIVRLSGGDVSFESSPDGSTVVVELPPAEKVTVSEDDEQSRPVR